MTDRPALRLEPAINDALALYEQTHPLTPQGRIRARKDFQRFYAQAISMKLAGIRWNFNGCIFCIENRHPARLQRILICHPLVVQSCGNRPLGTVVCKLHQGNLANEDEILSAALLRILVEPTDTTE